MQSQELRNDSAENKGTIDVSSIQKGGKLVDTSMASSKPKKYATQYTGSLDKGHKRTKKNDMVQINLTNQKNIIKKKTRLQLEREQRLAKPGMARGNTTTTAQMTFGISSQKSKKKSKPQALGEDSLIMNEMDVMSSSEAESNPDPDLQPQSS